MTVFPDEVFLLNMLLDYLLLAAAGLLSDGGQKRYRKLLAAFFGGIYAAFAAVYPPVAAWPARFAAFAVLCLAAYGTGKAALRQAALFLLVCCGYGGTVLLAALALRCGAVLLAGLPYYTVSKRLLILLAGLLYCGIWLTMRCLCRHFGELVRVKLDLQGHCTEVTALCDTGNTLKDPISGEAVIIADLQTAKKLLPQLCITQRDLQQPAAALQLLMRLKPQTKPRLIPFQTVSGSSMMLAVRCDKIEVNGKSTANRMLAFSPTAFSEGTTYHALTGGIYESDESKTNPLAACIPAQRIRALYRRQRHSSSTADTCGGTAAAAKHGAGQ